MSEPADTYQTEPPATLNLKNNISHSDDQYLLNTPAAQAAANLLQTLANARDQPRNLAQAANDLTDLVTTNKDALPAVEFFAPQFAHTLVHIADAQLGAPALERFLLTVATLSSHLAFNLYWMLYSALLESSPKRKGASVATHRRCALALKHLEQCVAYGMGIGSSAPFVQAADAAVRLATQTSVDAGDAAVVSGYLYKKGGGTTTKYSRRGWTRRYFEVTDRIMYYYVNKSAAKASKPRGSIALSSVQIESARADSAEDATVGGAAEGDDTHYDLTLRDAESGQLFELRASSEAERTMWLDALGHTIRMPGPPTRASTPAAASVEPPPAATADAQEEQEEEEDPKLAEQRQRRYEHFVRQRGFVRGLIDLAEELRFAPVEGAGSRQQLLQPGLDRLPLSSAAYFPLAKSSDMLQQILRFAGGESIVFNTKARCPLLLVIETQQLHVTVAECCDHAVRLEASANASLRESWAECLKLRAPGGGSPDASARSAEPEGTALSLSDKKRELWDAKEKRIAAASSYSSKPGWTLRSLIVKSNDDVRQEVFVMQLISFLEGIFPKSLTWLKPYEILATGPDSGLLETIVSAQDIDRLKKTAGYTSLLNLYVERYGPVGSEGFNVAQDKFCRSLAGYSVIMYLLLLRDRHNGNLMIDGEGHYFHIDFGFCLGHSTGKQIGGMIEHSPFKLTKEYVELLGGTGSPVYARYCEGVVEAMVAARRHADVLCTLVEISGTKSNFPCFKQTAVAKVVSRLRRRLFADRSEEELRRAFPKVIEEARENKGTHYYDYFQRLQQGYAM